MRPRGKTEEILKQAEKLIAEKKKNTTLGQEIESLKIELMPEDWQQEYKRLYVLAKNQSPEIWESNAYNLPDESYYKNKDFFELLDYLININFLCGCYPEHKDELRGYFDEDDKIELMYDYLQWYLKTHDDLLDFSQLKKYADDTLENRRKYIKQIKRR